MLSSIKAACQYIVIILVKLFSIRYFQHQVIFDSIDENVNFIARASYFLFQVGRNRQRRLTPISQDAITNLIIINTLGQH